MNKIQQYLEKQNKIILEDKNKTLVSLDLFEKVYSPSNQKSFEYNKYDYVNGEKRYYKESAIIVTDEEYALILDKAKQVAAIKTKEEIEIEKERNKISYKMIKKLLPIFKKTESEWLSINDKEKVDTGKSKIAFIFKIIAWLILVISFIVGLIVTIEIESFIPFLIVLASAIFIMLILYASASILDYLAEITAVLRNGFKYSETNK